MRLPALVLAVVFTLGAATAGAATVRDIIELSRTGVSDEILIALIEVEGRVFPIDTQTLKELKDGGVSDRVIIAMVRSGRAALPAPVPAPPEPVYDVSAAAPAPQVVVIDHHEPAVREVREVREVVVPYPIYIPVERRMPSPERPAAHGAATEPFSTIGLPHAPTTLMPRVRRRSDPPYWWEMQQPRR